MGIRRIIAGGMAVACTTLTLTAASVSPANADSHYGCTYPRVCFYKTQADWQRHAPTAAYKDLTTFYQSLGPRSARSYAVYNSRNNDGASLRFSNHRPHCLKPGHLVFTNGAWVNGIRIMDSPSC
jgi:hypothetical protein